MKLEELAQRVEMLIKAVDEAKNQFMALQGRLAEARDMHMMAVRQAQAEKAPEEPVQPSE